MKEQAKKSYSFYFNASAWLSSQSVRLMSKAERGVYIHLLATAWGSKQPGTLPASEDQVRRLAECTVAEWAEMGPAILEVFPLSECQSYRYNERLMQEVQKERVKSERAVKSANARWKCDDDANASENHANASKNDAIASAKQCENDAQEQEQEQVIEQSMPDADSATPPSAGVGSLPKAEPCPLTAKPGGRAQTGKGAPVEEGPLGFAAFWQAYHGPKCEKRGSKKVAEKRWGKLSEATRRHILDGVEIYREQATANGNQYLPYAEKFLNPDRALWAAEDYGRPPAQPVFATRPVPAAMPIEPLSLWGATTTTPNPVPATSQYVGKVN